MASSFTVGKPHGSSARRFSSPPDRADSLAERRLAVRTSPARSGGCPMVQTYRWRNTCTDGLAMALFPAGHRAHPLPGRLATSPVHGAVRFHLLEVTGDRD